MLNLCRLLRHPAPRHVRRPGRDSSRGFSLTEFAIVIGIIGAMAAGIWSYASIGRERTRREQMAEVMTTLIEAVRAANAGLGNISGPVSVLMPRLIGASVLPPSLVRPVSASCTNASGLCADTPWGNANSGGTLDASGTLRACSWTLGTDTACNAGAASQFFAIELNGLNYDACIWVATNLSSANGPSGLTDVFINGGDVLAQATISLPVPPKVANALCTTPAKSNIVDFVYRLRMPTT
jgi:type II secretory pathway pseudopilin PulG